MTYAQYLKYDSIPAGAVLRRILQKEKMTQRELSARSGISSQRINDFISGFRRFTVDNSLRIEKCLAIDINGFFYILQTNHDIFEKVQEMEMSKKPDLTKFRQVLFWDVDFDQINWIAQQDWVIQRAFEYGNGKEIGECLHFYGKDAVEKSLSRVTSLWKKTERENNIKQYLS